MALYLKVSNSLENLSIGFTRNLMDAKSNVFQPHFIVTQTDGMNNWLKQQLAEYLGIAANCKFMRPNELLYFVYNILGGPFTSTLSRQNLSWLIYQLMGQADFKDKFPAVAAYFQGQKHQEELMRMGLADKLSDLFDQYQVYRPEMIEDWETKADEGLEMNDWQAWLWVRLKKVTQSRIPGTTTIGNYILEKLSHSVEDNNLTARMPVVHLFGLSIITAFHVKILHELSRHIDVYFHILNPAPEVFWFEDRAEKQLARWRQKGLSIPEYTTTGNPLLTGWGQLIQNSFSQFFTYDSFLNAYEEIGIQAPVSGSLLGKIQDDIFRAATADRHLFSAADLKDGSLVVNSCYTVAREVEVLYNYLVHLVDKGNEQLSPRDIVVMVSDIDTYAPYIKAVFNNAPYKFRYTIADESYADSDNLYNALLAILSMNRENFTSEKVLQLLDFSYIRKRFAIPDPQSIRPVLEAANIRFGIEGRESDDTQYVSWKYGIQRIMYGICMSGSLEYGTGSKSFYPLDILEGAETHEVIRFCHFAQTLMTAVELQEENKSIQDWVSYIEQLIQNLVFDAQDDIDEDYAELMKQLTEYNALHQLVTEAVSFNVFYHSLEQILQNATRSGLFVNGGITFCSLIPMRSIPFKVVALLGMNFDKFPRTEKSTSFNLMDKERRKGDRNVKENDKHLFLETVLSAKAYLYISYIGRNDKDNSLLPPSPLLDELLDYIEDKCTDPKLVRTLLVTQHPLQGFSRKYYQQDNNLYNYLYNQDASFEEYLLQEPQKVEIDAGTIPLDDLCNFFKHPVKAFFNKVLGIYYNEESVLLEETERFDLDQLDQWQLKNILLPLDEGGIPHLQQKLLKTGKLPLKNMATVAIANVEEELAESKRIYRQLVQDVSPATVDIDLQVGETKITGSLTNIFDKQLVYVCWSKGEMKYLIDAYIKYLVGIAAGEISSCVFLSTKKENTVYKAINLQPGEAIIRLQQLIVLFNRGMQQPVPFFPGWRINLKKLNELEPGFVQKWAKDSVSENAFSSTADPYIKKAVRIGYFEQDGLDEACMEVIQATAVQASNIFDDTL
ncbi:exodeoxyribonuclease V subunit gamma [Chitinophaga caeni]|uniref:RecBCD enzyme subunit RecC n=1 Tax=Chitinophaga caeni TaxID=2029983 RepID=A0A291QYR1_9BACT|nr:exodeoxyribonuclease V subunit gamma [Chitinophaga caeni]ATL49169.1 exodeoxyribonuclease V subunit gamma [Chitinophaga caeni]